MLQENQLNIESLEEEKAELTKQLDSLRLMQSLLEYDPTNEQSELENIEKKLNDFAESLGKKDDDGFKEKTLEEKRKFLHNIINEKANKINELFRLAGLLKKDEFIFNTKDSQGKLVHNPEWEKNLKNKIQELNLYIAKLEKYNKAFEENETDKFLEEINEFNENKKKLIEIFNKNANVIFDNF